jgi:hypothetical protein
MSEENLDWPFDQGPNVAAITCRSVIEGAPILYASHDDDDGWQFLDGNEVNQAEGRPYLAPELSERDPR